jgi:hypothetical protein
MLPADKRVKSLMRVDLGWFEFAFLWAKTQRVRAESIYPQRVTEGRSTSCYLLNPSLHDLPCEKYPMSG